MSDSPAVQARIGLVTVTYNSSSVLDDFLDSVTAQLCPGLRLYAVDNASTDDSVEKLRVAARATSIVIIEKDINTGVAAANNDGIVAALEDGCEWVLIINNDTIFEPRMIADLVSVADRSGASILSPLIEAVEPPRTVWFTEGHIVPWQGLRTFHDRDGGPMSEVRSAGTRVINYAPTCCLLVRRTVFEAIGLMDPVYFVYFDDVDFCFRATQAGFRYWATSDVEMIHKASSLTGGKQSTFTYRWTARNWPLLAMRNLGWPRATLALIFIQAWMAGRLITRLDSPKLYLFRQRRFFSSMAAVGAPPPPRWSGRDA